MSYSIKAVVLAAGKGTRIQTENIDLPKVMRTVRGKPLLHYVLDALSFIPNEDIILAVGYRKEDVIAYFHDYTFAEQVEQLGTGHAVMSASAELSSFDGGVLVCCGDMPLLTRETYTALAGAHLNAGNDCTILSSSFDTPLPYGRIVRDESGGFLKIVEEKDCTPDERLITELNSGVYIFDAKKLLPALSELKSDNAQSEYYITDIPAILLEQGAKIGILKRNLGDEIVGVNTVEQLEQVEEILSKREQ